MCVLSPCIVGILLGGGKGKYHLSSDSNLTAQRFSANPVVSDELHLDK